MKMNEKKEPDNFANRATGFIKKNKKGFFILLAIVIVLVVFITVMTSSKEKTEEKQTDSQEENINTQKTSVKSPEIEDPVPMENNKTEKSEEETAKGEPFYNSAHGYQFILPESFSPYESQDIVYARNNDKKTQIAIILIPGTFTDGIATWEQSTQYIYKIKALLTDEEGVTEEKETVNYGTELKSDITIGDFAVKQELGEMWFRNTGESHNIKLPECGYFTTFNGNGLVLIGTSQTEDSTAVFSYMKQILSGMKSYTPETEALEMTTYQSDGADGVKFSYPKDWSMTKNNDGMVTIKAPETQSSSYAGFCIQFYADANKKTVEDFAQFSAAYETEILKDTFVQEVADSDFTFTSVVTHMDLEKKIKEKDCIYFEVADTIYPASSSVRNSMGINKEKVNSRRYTFRAGGSECMVNFIVPNDNCDSLIEQIVNSLQIP